MVKTQLVALLTESVDWNDVATSWAYLLKRRSPHGERGLKSVVYQIHTYCNLSLSSRRAWIEISCIPNPHILQPVALLTESVDWNVTEQETVDFGLVALLTESVDWNQSEGTFLDTNSLSLSSRRAWIEILKQTVADKLDGVALLTESVDWNFKIIEDNPRIKGRSPHGERGLKF